MRNSGLLFGLLAVVLVTLVTPTPLKSEESLSVERFETIYRLPTTVIPEHYDIDLVPYFTNGSSNFRGRVTINFNVTSITNVIILHSDELNINASLTTVHSVTDQNRLNIAAQSYDPLRKFYILSFTSNLPVGMYNVSFSYSGEFATDMYGLYRSSYRVGNETRWLMTSQFQPTAARRAFPCFDEPGFKATFNIRIAHFAHQMALANTRNVSTSHPDDTIGGRVWTQFELTPVMSTYLLAFVISEFEKLSNPDETFTIYSRAEAIDTAAWALEATQTLHPIFINVVQTLDPSPKVDQVAVPDFPAGAMENWGLFVYREVFLLWKEGESNLRAREFVASVISHELAHIWFGNLVTPAWWNHLWFSEGFASFLQYRIPSLTYPQWRFAERIVTDLQFPALVADSFETTRAMTNVVGSRASVLDSFDNIAYSKSGSIFRMLNRFIREDFFSRALATFFNEASWGTFDPDTLWRHMQLVADSNSAVQNHISIATIMETWTKQPGYPLVTVSRNYSTMVAAISQERFFMNRNSPTADPERQRWWIPITFAFGGNPTRCNLGWIQPDWIRAQDKAIMISGFANDTWVLVNCQAIGFYRTNYDTRNWELLTEFLHSSNFTLINAVNRAVLIDDSLNLARASYIDYSIPLNLISYLVHEDDFVVWRSAISAISYLNRMLESNEYFVHWQSFLRSLVSNLYQSVGWIPAATDPHMTRIHREQILNLACQLDVPGARASAEDLFNRWIINPQQNRVDPDLKSAVYCWGARTASAETWNIMFDRSRAANLASEEDLLLRGLACSQDLTILGKYLQLSIMPESGIRAQDAFTVFTSVLNSGENNIKLCLNFVKTNTSAISEFYGGFNIINNMLSVISSRVTTEDQFEMLRAVVSSNELGASSVVIEHALRNAKGNLEWISDKVPVIQTWLRDNDFVSDNTTEEVTDSTTEGLTDSTTEEITDYTTEGVTDVTTEEVTYGTTEVADTTTAGLTDSTTEEITDYTTEGVTDVTTEEVTYGTTEVADTTTAGYETTTEGNAASTFTSSLFFTFTTAAMAMSYYSCS